MDSTNAKQSNDAPPPITSTEAIVHLVKANLGPGALNLPHAFTQTGWALGGCLMLFVGIQGVYCMWLLAYCKQLIAQKEPQVHTFMDVTSYTLGHKGELFVQFSLAILQGGVCTVFIQLISTNFQSAMVSAGWHLSITTAIIIVTAVLVPISLFRNISQMKWVSLLGNVFMIVAVLTVICFSFVEISDRGIGKDAMAATSDVGAIAQCLSSLFYAFEGIGLVLPVENSMGHNNREFASVVLQSNAFLSILFMILGSVSAAAFPGITNGSITAYLVDSYDNTYFEFVNGIVTLAVLLTFPLQLVPVIEVIEECECSCGGSSKERRRASTMVCEEDARSSLVPTPESAMDEQGISDTDAELGFGSCKTALEYARMAADTRTKNSQYATFYRLGVLACCASLALLVHDVGLLVSLFGAVGQTGLVIVPCAVHLKLQAMGVAPPSRLWASADVLVIIICGFVMVYGTFSAVRDVVQELK